MTKIVVTGAAGRMGQRIIVNLLGDAKARLAGAVEVRGHQALGKDPGRMTAVGSTDIVITDSLEKVLASADVVIDFSYPDATIPNLRTVSKLGKAAVIGTTGHSAEQRKEIEKMSTAVPIVLAPNMSVGVNVLWKVLSIAAPPLAATSKISVVETHHVHKKDAPSGTALEIERVLKRALGNGTAEIEIKSIREGEIVGDHTVTFDSPEETITLTHHAKTRDTFAVGAIRAAKWVVGKPAGLYTMQDVLG